MAEARPAREPGGPGAGSRRIRGSFGPLIGLRFDSTRPELTIVTAASANHATCVRNLLRSIELAGVEATRVVYGLGLGPADERSLRARCHELRRFDFGAYPSHVDIRRHKGRYAWKPILVAETAERYGGLVLWLDAGDLVHGDLDAVRRTLREQGVYTPVSSGTIRDWTHTGTLRYLDAAPELLSRRNRNGAIVGIDTGHAGARELLRRWRSCALVEECIAPPGSDRTNHRQDQAVLSVLFYQLQEVYGWKPVDRKLAIGTHHDSVPPDELERVLSELRG